MAQLMPPNTLGHLVLLGVEVEVEDEDDAADENETTWLYFHVWTPNTLLEKDKHLECSYYNCIDGMSWDDWTGAFRPFMADNMCETGEHDTYSTWENVRLDDPRIDVAFVDPLHNDYSKRCLSQKQLKSLRGA